MKRIRTVNAVFEGRNNAYVLGEGGGSTTVLIDTGLGNGDTHRAFTEEFTRQDLDPAELDEILVTHFHADHAGLAGSLQRESDATVRAHPDDAPLVARERDAIDEFETRRESLIRRWGVPNSKLDALYEYVTEHNAYADPPPTVTRIPDRTTIDCGTTTIEAVHLPGHTAGHCGFVVERESGSELFCGDALLPQYTPNVGGTDVRLDAPLEKYLETLRWIRDSGFVRAWPGHRDVIDSPAERAAEIIAHHRSRARQIQSLVVDHGPISVWDLSTRLFGDLEGVHIMAGVGETHAHLLHLEANGIVEHRSSGYVVLKVDHDLAPLFE